MMLVAVQVVWLWPTERIWLANLLSYCSANSRKKRNSFNQMSFGSRVNEPKCQNKNKISHGNNNNKDKQELTAKSKTHRGKKNLRAKKEIKKEKKWKLFFLEPSKCHANFALDFSPLDFFLVFKFFSRIFSRLRVSFRKFFSTFFSPSSSAVFSIFFSTFSRLFFPTFFPTFNFFLDFFHGLSDTSKAHSWVEVLRDMAWFDSWLCNNYFIYP